MSHFLLRILAEGEAWLGEGEYLAQGVAENFGEAIDGETAIVAGLFSIAFRLKFVKPVTSLLFERGKMKKVDRKHVICKKEDRKHVICKKKDRKHVICKHLKNYL